TKEVSDDAGTRWKESHTWRPIERSLMSTPTTRTSRSPFSRSARTRAAVPGDPDAVSRTVTGLKAMPRVPGGASRASGCPAAQSADRPVGGWGGSGELDPIGARLWRACVAPRREHRLHRLAHRRAAERPDLRVRQQLQPLELPRRERGRGIAAAPVLVR